MHKVKPLQTGATISVGNGNTFTAPEPGNYEISYNSVMVSGYPDGVYDCRNYNEQDWLETLEHFEKTYPEAALAMKKRNTKLYKALK